MLSELMTAIWRLDQWLKAHLGRLYNTILASSLGMGIVASVDTLQKALGSTAGVASVAFTVAIQTALLINQLSQLHEYRQAGRERRAARRAAQDGKTPSSEDR